MVLLLRYYAMIQQITESFAAMIFTGYHETR